MSGTDAAAPVDRPAYPRLLDPWDVVESLLVVAAVIVASMGLAGLVLGMMGRYSTALASVFALPPVAASVWAVLRRPRERSPFGWVPLAVAGVLILVVTLGWAWNPSQHVLVNRDPGSYTTTAVHLVTDGSLRVDQTGTPFEDVDARPEGAAYVTGPGTYEFQFNHLLSAVLAPAFDLATPGVMFRVPALLAGLGLMASYAVAVRATRRPWLAILVPAVLGASMPLLYVARDTFSESLTLLLLWTGLLAALKAVPKCRWPHAAVAGWLFGAAIAARVDALVYVVALTPLVVLWGGRPGDDRRHRIVAVAAGAAAMVAPLAIGQIDLEFFTGSYSADLASNTSLLRLGAAAAAATGVLLVLLRPLASSVSGAARERFAIAGALVTAGWMVHLWFIRPTFQVDRYSQRPALTGYQAAEGIAVDPTRSHQESAFAWMEWYFGPLLVTLAVVGFALVVHRAIRGGATPAQLLAVAVGLVAGLLYWWRPSIFADQPWASRRFVPAVYPSAAIAAVIALGAVSGSLQRLAVSYRRLIVAAVAVATLVPAAVATWPVREGRSQSGYLATITTICDTVGDDAAVATIELGQPRRLAPAVRAWCDVPTVALGEPTSGELADLASEWAQLDRTLWVVSGNKPTVEAAVPATPPVDSAVGAGDFAIRRSLTRVPDGYREPEPVRYWMAPVPAE